MPANVREVVVFIASPGDLEEERAAVRQAADALNNLHSSLSTARIRVTGWEHVQPEHERPQQVINELVDECDVFLGLLYRKWGSPTGEYDSGFEEEYQRALQRRTESGSPDIAIYFKGIPQELLSDPGPQLSKVLKFQRRFQEEHNALYREFPSLEDFKLRIYTFFNSLLISHLQPEVQAGSREGTVAKLPQPSTEVSHIKSADPARRQISETLSAFAELAEAGSTSSNLDIDRLLMVSLAFQPEMVAIPIHALNRLYGDRKGMQISAMEYKLLVWTLADNYGQAAREAPNVAAPAWYFLDARSDGGLRDLTDALVSLAFETHDDFVVRYGAFRLLAFIKAKPIQLWASVTEKGVSEASLVPLSLTGIGSTPIERWEYHLNGTDSTGLALDYMADVAGHQDVDFIRELASRVESRSTRSRLQAIANYMSDDFDGLMELASSYVTSGSWEEKFLLHGIEHAKDDDLLRLISAKNMPIHLNLAAFNKITSRRALSAAEISRALGRKNDELVTAIFDAVDRAGTAEAKVAAIEAIASLEDRKIVEEHKFRLLALVQSAEELRALAADSHRVIDAWPALALLEGPAGMGDEARAILDTDCASHIDIEKLESFGYKGSVLAFLRGKLRLAALEVLERVPEDLREHHTDVQRMRTELHRRYMVTQEKSALILAARGNEEDAAAILEVADKTQGRRTLISGAIKLGGVRVARKCLTSKDPEKATLGAIALIQRHTIGLRELKDLLYSEHSSVRIQAVYELRRRFTDAQLEDSITEYRNRSTGYYYDVVAAIDRMLYAPISLAEYVGGDVPRVIDS